MWQARDLGAAAKWRRECAAEPGRPNGQVLGKATRAGGSGEAAVLIRTWQLDLVGCTRRHPGATAVWGAAGAWGGGPVQVAAGCVAVHVAHESRQGKAPGGAHRLESIGQAGPEHARRTDAHSMSMLRHVVLGCDQFEDACVA